MLFRSSNSKFTHFQGDALSNIDDSSHGVHLTGGSTGGIVQPCGDEANVSLIIRGKGTAGIFVTPETTSATAPTASTTPWRGMQRYLVQYTVPALSSGPASAESTITVTGVTTNSILVFSPRVQTNTTGAVSVEARCSTINELTLQYSNQSASTLSGSTQSGYLLQFAF